MRDRALLFKRAVTEGFVAAAAQGFLATFTRLRQCSSLLVSLRVNARFIMRYFSAERQQPQVVLRSRDVRFL